MKRITALMALGLGVTLGAQQPSAPTFTSHVEMITLDVHVVDQKGQFVDGLTRDDFTIFEDGREQTIGTFEHVSLPIKTGAPTTSEARLYVLLMDDLRTNPARTADVRAEARDFLEHHFTGTDRAVVLTTSGRVRSAQDFTSDRERLLRAVDQFSATTGAMSTSSCENSGGDLYQCQANNDRSALSALTSISTWLGTISGQRKAVLLFGEGLSFDQAANALGPDPTTATGFQGIENSDDPRLTPGAIRLNARTTMAEAAYRTVAPALVQAAGTAARANVTVYELDPRRHPENSYARIVADASSYYLLGYVPTNGKHDGTFRKLEVRSRRSSLHVQARAGYTAASDTAPTRPADISTALADVMAAPIQISGLTMSASAAAYAGAALKPSVEVIVDVAGQDLTAASNQAGKGSLDLLVIVVDANGDVKASERGALAMNLTPATRDAVAQRGLRVLSRLDVPPGHYLLRIAGIDGAGIAKGSAQYDLDVPDFAQTPLALSGLALSAESDLQRPITGSDKRWTERFAQPPTAARAFSADDNLFVSGEIYRSGARLMDIEVRTTVQTAAGEVVFERDQTLDATDVGSSTLHHQTKLPLRDLDAGNYLLLVRASAAADATATSSRQIPFVIRQSAVR